MAYDLRHREDGEWIVFKRDSGQVVGHARSRKAAESSMRARLMGERMGRRK